MAKDEITSYVNLGGGIHEISWKEFFEAFERIRAFFQAVQLRFIERERLKQKAEFW